MIAVLEHSPRSTKDRNQGRPNERDTYGFIGNIEDPADEVSVSAVLHRHVLRRRLVERGHRRCRRRRRRRRARELVVVSDAITCAAAACVRGVFGTP